MENIQIVVSVIRFRDAAGPTGSSVGRFNARDHNKSWVVKLGLDTVGVVYKMADDFSDHADDDQEFYAPHAGRWVWESDTWPVGGAGSLDLPQDGMSYDDRMTAVYSLLSHRS